MTVDRHSLVWRLGSRLALVLIGLTAVGLLGLVVHTHAIEASHGHHGLVHDVIREFFLDLAWGIPLFISAIIVTGAWIVRRTVAPLHAVADAARRISPTDFAARLPVQGVPTEMRPVVDATNDALDRLQQAYAQQQRFIANAAHELRTPVAVFRAGVERLAPSPDRDALLGDVERLTRLTAQLLDLARAERPCSEAQTDAAAVAREEAARLGPLAAARQVALAFEGDETMLVRGHREHLTPILRNLIENAINHAPAASEVVIGCDAHAGRITVTDAGPGVPAQMREAIFERFTRGAWTTSSGSGLGLSIAREAAARIGAAIRLANTAKGACFIVELR